jgi:hypothetical protein
MALYELGTIIVTIALWSRDTSDFLVLSEKYCSYAMSRSAQVVSSTVV